MPYTKSQIAQRAIRALNSGKLSDLYQARYECKNAISLGFDEGFDEAPEISESDSNNAGYLMQQALGCLKTYDFTMALRYIEALRFQKVASALAKKA